MSAMPLHYMQAFRLPVGVIKHIDRMRKSFLWKGNNTCKGINCLVNWEKVCALKVIGDLGIIDMRCQNDALLAKWIWAVESGRSGLWLDTVRLLHGVWVADHMAIPGPHSSFFAKDLSLLLPFCSASIKLEGGACFSCASAYRAMHHSGVISASQKALWTIKIPMKVRIFLWLMLDNKILTQQVLHSRGCQVQVGCHLCSSTAMETRDHLMWNCGYASAL